MSTQQSVTRPGVGEEQYRVPKVAVPVQLILDGGTNVAGEVYLLPVAGTHVGRERVVDLLSNPENHFLPLCTPDGVRLVHQTRIVVAWVSEPEDSGTGEIGPGLGAPGMEATVIPVELELVSLPAELKRMTGQIELVMPPGQQRVIDFLNLEAPFFSIVTAEGLALINKRYVLDLWQV